MFSFLVDDNSKHKEAKGRSEWVQVSTKMTFDDGYSKNYSTVILIGNYSKQLFFKL